MRVGASVASLFAVIATTSCMKQYAGDLARAGDVPGCARVLEEEENFTRAAAREKCEFIAGFAPDEYPEDVYQRERAAERRVATKVREATTPSVGRVVKRSSMGKASYILEDMTLQTSGQSNALALDVSVFTIPDQSVLSFGILVSFRKTRDWTYLECNSLGFFGSSPVPGSYEGDDGYHWLRKETDHKGGTAGDNLVEAVYTTTSTAELDILARAETFGFQLCRDKVVFDDAQKKRLTKYVELVRDKMVPASRPEEGGGEPAIAKVGVPECDHYIERYLECIKRVPEEARREILKAVAQAADAWKQAASGPAADTLAPVCSKASKTAKEVTEELGCRWD